MTERQERYRVMRPETALQRQVVARLRAAGWLVVVTAQDRATRGQVAGLPDLLCFRQGTTALLELKAPGGQLRPAQVDFLDRIAPHLGPRLIYRVIYSVEQVDVLCEV